MSDWTEKLSGRSLAISSIASDKKNVNADSPSRTPRSLLGESTVVAGRLICGPDILLPPGLAGECACIGTWCGRAGSEHSSIKRLKTPCNAYFSLVHTRFSIVPSSHDTPLQPWIPQLLPFYMPRRSLYPLRPRSRKMPLRSAIICAVVDSRIPGSECIDSELGGLSKLMTRQVMESVIGGENIVLYASVCIPPSAFSHLDSRS